jgi:adenosylcobinamide kinase/adenosylcobinamide-phosphate guanylyltransferase
MQLFIGGACAGKREAVRSRFPGARWHCAYDGKALEAWRDTLPRQGVLVLEGWECWLAAWLVDEPADAPDDDSLRQRLRMLLATWQDLEREAAVGVVLILPEMGRGIVPLDRSERRLRDLAGWLAQDTAACCEAVWYVRHGLVQRLSADVPTAGNAADPR